MMNYTEAMQIIETKRKARATIRRVEKLLINPATTSFEKGGLRLVKEQAKTYFKAVHISSGEAYRTVLEYEAVNNRQVV